MSRGFGARMLALALALVFGAACDRGDRGGEEASNSASVARSELANVFLIVLDAASAEFFGPYGDAHATSPAIDAFARESVVFVNAYSQSATTTASSASLLTGVRGTTHLMTGQTILPLEFKTAAERFRALGYRTYGFIGNPFAGAAELGLDRGYDDVVQIYALAEFQETRATEGSTGFKVTLPEDLNAVVWARLAGFEERGTFAYFHYLQPHKPYDAPHRYAEAIRAGEARCRCSGAGCPCGTLSWQSLGPAFDASNETGEASPSTVEHMKARYRANVRYVDDGLGELFARLKADGLYDESVIVLLADHGDAFFKHGRFGHNRTLYDDMVRIPMIAKFPKSAAVPPQRIEHLVESVDVLPTIFDFLGVPVPRCFEGESLWPLVSGAAGSGASLVDEVILATNRRDKHAIRRGDFKYILSSDGREELYDLGADPDERRDLAAAMPDRVAALRARLESVVDPASEAALPENNQLRADPEMNRLLEELGYVESEDQGASTPVRPGADATRPSMCTD